MSIITGKGRLIDDDLALFMTFLGVVSAFSTFHGFIQEDR
jgi:hypothetical protein